jgi:hypothetical protein
MRRRHQLWFTRASFLSPHASDHVTISAPLIEEAEYAAEAIEVILAEGPRA